MCRNIVLISGVVTSDDLPLLTCPAPKNVVYPLRVKNIVAGYALSTFHGVPTEQQPFAILACTLNNPSQGFVDLHTGCKLMWATHDNNHLVLTGFDEVPHSATSPDIESSVQSAPCLSNTRTMVVRDPSGPTMPAEFAAFMNELNPLQGVFFQLPGTSNQAVLAQERMAEGNVNMKVSELQEILMSNGRELNSDLLISIPHLEVEHSHEGRCTNLVMAPLSKSKRHPTAAKTEETAGAGESATAASTPTSEGGAAKTEEAPAASEGGAKKGGIFFHPISVSWPSVVEEQGGTSTVTTVEKHGSAREVKETAEEVPLAPPYKPLVSEHTIAATEPQPAPLHGEKTTEAEEAE
ncbi:MAG: hypothetical protein MHM6MM_002405 [Cercozoa sp. M6MM]